MVWILTKSEDPKLVNTESFHEIMAEKDPSYYYGKHISELGSVSKDDGWRVIGIRSVPYGPGGKERVEEREILARYAAGGRDDAQSTVRRIAKAISDNARLLDLNLDAPQF